jgi:hypothetical protein
MTHQQYCDCIAGISEEKAKERDAKLAKDGITYENCDYDGKGKTWDGTLVFEHGVPVSVGGYSWDAPKHVVEKDLCEKLGFAIKLVDGYDGNGHWHYKIKVVDNG